MQQDRRIRQPDVHRLSQSLLDFVTKGLRPTLNPLEGGGSANMLFMIRVRDFFADSVGGRGPLIAALSEQERVGMWCINERCEQGVGSEHLEYHLCWTSLLLLDAVRRGDAEISGYMQRLFSGLYAIALNTSTPKGAVLLMPGARQSVFGPHTEAGDASVGVISGRLHATPFRNLYADTCAPWALLQVLAKVPTLFDEARSWTVETAPAHWYKLRWPLAVAPHEGGHSALISVPLEDSALMGKIGSGGIGTTEVRVDYGSGTVGWLAAGKWWVARPGDKLAHPISAPLDLGALVGSVRAAA
jgi:hypothetical protein